MTNFLYKNLVSQGQRDPGGSGTAYGHRRAQQTTLVTNFLHKNLVSQGQRDPGGSGAAFGHGIWTRTSPTNHPSDPFFFFTQKPCVTGPARSRWQWRCIWTQTSPTNYPLDQFLLQKPRVTGPARSRWQWRCIWTQTSPRCRLLR